MELSVSSLRREQCTGCGVCSNFCPASAITMEADSEGFTYPKIDEVSCVNCGLCCQVCSTCTEIKNDNSSNPVCYAMMAEQEIRERSSSGGMFGLIAQYILENGGAVVGCAYSDKLEAEHILITDVERLSLLFHSKYSQSRMEDIYRKTKEYLDANPGKTLLFSGCPCHVAGVRAFLGKEYSNLILVDIICHGVPSPKVFQQYLKELSDQKGSEVDELTFRDKLVYGWATSVSAKFHNGKVYYGSEEDPYLKAYLKNLMSRPSCAECRFTTIPRQGDITLGDFWGIMHVDKYMDDTRGTSLVLVNNTKGEEILSAVYDKCRRIKEMPLELAVEKQAHLRRPAVAHARRSDFFKLLKRHTVEEAEEMVLNDRYDVGVLGAWYFPNYGTTLTYFALHTVLEELGYSVLMIDKPKIKENDIERKDNYARAFAQRHQYAVSEVYDIDDTIRLNDLCDTFMLGSDQMWTWTRCEQFGTYYFLDFAQDNKKKIVYAGSFGKDDFFAPEEGRVRCAYYAARIDAVSVREDQGVEVAKKRFGIDAEFVLDPIFLCNPMYYEGLIAESKRKLPEKPYIMTYILDPTVGKREAILHASKQMNLEVINALNGVPWMQEQNAERLNLPNIQRDIGLEDMLFYYKNADFIITDSFHGSCFAILFKKPFICIANKQRGIPRFHSLFGLFGLMDRLVYRPGEIKNAPKEFFYPEIDYDRVYSIIDSERERSLQWLVSALETEKKVRPSTYDILMREVKRLEKELKKVQKDEPDNITDGM